MLVLSLDEYLAAIEARRAALAMVDGPAETDAMRNKGGARTAEKRELLRRAAARAEAAGIEPVRAYF
jgi:hypothetical protein